MSDEQQEDQPTGQRPITSFRGTGGLSVAVWKHKSDDGPDRYSINIERSYRNKEGEFESTSFLRENDLLRTQKLLDLADAWIEQDKAHQRGTAAVQR